MIVGTYVHQESQAEEVRLTFNKNDVTDVLLAVLVFNFMKANPETYIDVHGGIESQLNSLLERYKSLLNPQ